MERHELQERIGRNVRVLMAIRGMNTQQALAARLGLAKAEMSKRMTGRTRWQLDDLPALADALGVQPADLLRPVAEMVTATAATGTDTPGDTPRTEGQITRQFGCSVRGSDLDLRTSGQVVGSFVDRRAAQLASEQPANLASHPIGDELDVSHPTTVGRDCSIRDSALRANVAV